jgi:alkylation response protein AidB-like acyl-CoA dehydrogenase
MTAADDRAENIRLIRDSAAAVAPPSGDRARVRALRFHEPGFDRGVWRAICAMGWIGLRVPAEAGGAGLGMQEYCALAEEFGAGLVPEPLIPGALAAAVLQGDPLAALLTGARIVLPAWQEAPGALDPGDQTTFDGARLNGRKLFVHMAAGAEAFLVVAGDRLALLARDAPGATLDIARTQDGGHFATLTLVDAPATSLPGRFAAGALDEAALATAAYLLGVMRQAFAMALEYLKTRRQFGRLIGSFQALQHRAADLKIQLELTRASVQAAAAVLDDIAASAAQRQAAVSRAKARASEAALLLTRQSIQLHGGIGYTDEYDVGLFLRKAMVLANLYGSPALHRARWAALAPEDEDGA